MLLKRWKTGSLEYHLFSFVEVVLDDVHLLADLTKSLSFQISMTNLRIDIMSNELHVNVLLVFS